MGANKVTDNRERVEGRIIFASRDHERAYIENLPRCRCQDVYHRALVYCLGIDRDTREHMDEIYDFSTGEIRPDCLRKGWQTSGSARIVRMAFSLYCNDVPTVYRIRRASERLEECRRYTVEDLFCCSYAGYFWEAVKIRYPEYCSCIQDAGRPLCARDTDTLGSDRTAISAAGQEGRICAG